MINNISPQKVQHSDGYTVQVADRFTVEYLDAHCQARIEVDFGETVGVYFSTLVVKNNNGAELNLNLSESEVIFDRIVAGIQAMGSPVERL